MTSVTVRRNNQDYVVPSSTSQDVQPSPLALLAATCSKIGAPPPSEEGGTQTNAGTTVRVIAPNQGGGEIVAPTWVQLPQGIVDASALKQTVGSPVTVGGGQVFQQANTAAGTPQVFAVTGPGGNISYNVVPQFQTVMVDGQEAIFIPASPSGIGAAQGVVPAAANNQTLVTPNGQIIRAGQAPVQASPANAISNMGFSGLQGNFVNLGGNIVNLAGVQNVRPNGGGVLQAIQMPQVQQLQNIFQIPVSTGQGQTTFQTVQIPFQALPISAFQSTPFQTLQGMTNASIVSNPQGGAVTTMAGSNTATQLTSVSTGTTGSQEIASQATVVEICPSPARNNQSDSRSASPQTVVSSQSLPVSNYCQWAVTEHCSEPGGSNQLHTVSTVYGLYQLGI
ncbi:hypothetical protein ScPMuIL_017320 [Solemya velum]